MTCQSLWQPIETAPQDRLVLLYASEKYGLPAFQCVAKWRPDAGWCVDELRDATHWQELPAPPTGDAAVMPETADAERRELRAVEQAQHYRRTAELLREALEWYADPAAYRGGNSLRLALIERDGGHRARIVLAACDDGVSL